MLLDLFSTQKKETSKISGWYLQCSTSVRESGPLSGSASTSSVTQVRKASIYMCACEPLFRCLWTRCCAVEHGFHMADQPDDALSVVLLGLGSENHTNIGRAHVNVYKCNSARYLYRVPCNLHGYTDKIAKQSLIYMMRQMHPTRDTQTHGD